jgi:hypothetical protein
MTKEFVPYAEALALKELGFDEPCFGYYVDGELRGINLGIQQLGGVEPYYQRFGFHTLSNHNIDNQKNIVVTAPTFSQVFRWFREKYNLISYTKIYIITDGVDEYHYEIKTDKIRLHMETPMRTFNTYEEAELECLKKLIEIVK